MFKPVDAANVSMVQRRTNNTGRDDLAAAPALVRGAFARAPKLRARLRTALLGRPMSIDVVNAPGRDFEVVIEPWVSIMNVPRFMPVERNDLRIVGFAPLQSLPETITIELVVLIALHLRGQARNDNDAFDVACIVTVIMFGRGREHQRAARFSARTSSIFVPNGCSAMARLTRAVGVSNPFTTSIISFHVRSGIWRS